MTSMFQTSVNNPNWQSEWNWHLRCAKFLFDLILPNFSAVGKRLGVLPCPALRTDWKVVDRLFQRAIFCSDLIKSLLENGPWKLECRLSSPTMHAVCFIRTQGIFTIGEAAWSTNGVWGQEGRRRRSKKITFNK